MSTLSYVLNGHFRGKCLCIHVFVLFDIFRLIAVVFVLFCFVQSATDCFEAYTQSHVLRLEFYKIWVVCDHLRGNVLMYATVLMEI